MKPGYKTTEFYASLAAAVAAAAASLAGALPNTVGAALASASAVGYALSRGLSKLNAAGVTNVDPSALLKAIEDIVAKNSAPTK